MSYVARRSIWFNLIWTFPGNNGRFGGANRRMCVLRANIRRRWSLSPIVRCRVRARYTMSGARLELRDSRKGTLISTCPRDRTTYRSVIAHRKTSLRARSRRVSASHAAGRFGDVRVFFLFFYANAARINSEINARRTAEKKRKNRDSRMPVASGDTKLMYFKPKSFEIKVNPSPYSTFIRSHAVRRTCVIILIFSATVGAD